MFVESKFTAPWWLKNCHLQTILAKYLRTEKLVSTSTQYIETSDNDFLELAWTELPQSNQVKPIVVLLHGLEGSIDSHYVQGMLNAIKSRGWIGVLLHFRGCGTKPNRTATSYHSGFTKDIAYFSQYLNTHFPKHNKALVGFSLGGNVTAKYLAESDDHHFKAASVICAPIHLESASKRINQGFSKVYQRYLVDMLKQSAQQKVEQFKLSHFDLHEISKANSIWQFDELYTAPSNGFKDAQDYYEQSSSAALLSKIDIPCLFIHAKDDPFLCDKHLASLSLDTNNVTFELSKRGGHVGFVTGNNPFKPKFWLEQRVPNFLSDIL
jgi:predicted alpha/beta-fold hydrolase